MIYQIVEFLSGIQLLLTILAYIGTIWLISILLRRIAIDIIEIWRRWQSAKMDVRRIPEIERLEDLERRARLLIWQEQARQQLSDHRLMIRAGYVPQLPGYIMKFVPSDTDIEVS